MSKKLKPIILIIGFGSIGQRHFRNINKIFKNNVNFILLRKNLKTPILTKNNKIKKIQKISSKNFKIINKLQDVELNPKKIHSAFICNPSSMHVDFAIKLLKKNINVFVEKPISNNLKNIKILSQLTKKSPAVTMVGYQMRFNPIINFLKKDKIIYNKIGNINFVQINHGENVKNFHIWENYEDSYTSRKKLGGGVTLSQIHELDYIKFLFRNYKIIKSKSIIDKVSNFKIDVDDTSSHLFLFKKNNKKIICNLNLNFFENPKNRTIKYIGDKGKLLADLNKNLIKIYTKNKILKKKFNFKRNDLFIDELKYFFKCIKNKRKYHDLNIKYGIENLKFTLGLFKN